MAFVTKTTKYNGYTEYGRQMKMSFRNLSLFWRSLSPETQKLFIEASGDSTSKAAGEREAIKKSVRSYPLCGPMGSQDPKLPIDTDHLYDELSKEGSTLKESWKKSNLTRWTKALDRESKPYVPGRKACALNNLTRLPGEHCIRCAKDKLELMETLRPLRTELKKGFVRARGKEFGMTVGILIKGAEHPLWRDVVIMSQNTGTFPLICHKI